MVRMYLGISHEPPACKSCRLGGPVLLGLLLALLALLVLAGSTKSGLGLHAASASNPASSPSACSNLNSASARACAML